MNCFLRIATAVAVGVLGSATQGHEFWIEPSIYSATTGAVVRVELRHGERFNGECVVRRDDLIERFTVIGPVGETPVVGRSGAGASYVQATGAGLHVIGYHSRRMTNRLDARDFEAYLHEEGLERISTLRAERGESDRPGREVYSRCAKSLITVDGGDTGADRVLGLPLEITLETNPAKLAPHQPLVAMVSFRGRPLAGAKVVAVSAESPENLIRIETGQDGRVEVVLPEPGPWMLTTIQMVAAPAGVDADWESFWASLTFAR